MALNIPEFFLLFEQYTNSLATGILNATFALHE